MYLLQPAHNDKTPLAVGLPVLAGEKTETLFHEAKSAGTRGCFSLENAAHWLIGRASVSAESGCELAAQRLYTDLFSAVGGLKLSRIWNFVPGINETGIEGIENYRAFCRGRSCIFEKVVGKGFEEQLPAASAVGSEDGRLTVVFAACDHGPQLFENPEQVAAYRYPEKYGPRSPSFSRAARVANPGGGTDVFISGTAAVVGHETASPGETLGQIECTIRNLRLISRACGLGDDLGRDLGAQRHLKVYLRHAADLKPVKRALESTLLEPGDRVTYLRADICRADLNLEIEATLIGVKTA